MNKRMQFFMAVAMMVGGFFLSTTAQAETREVQVYESAAGRTGHWWCENHFGGNLGGSWSCDAVSGSRRGCGYDAPYGSTVTCTKNGWGGGQDPYPRNEVRQVRTSGGPVAARTGQWWCENHFGGNLGGYWSCTSGSNCYNGYLRDGTTITCERR